jgi:hypothetical protein
VPLSDIEGVLCGSAGDGAVAVLTEGSKVTRAAASIAGALRSFESTRRRNCATMPVSCAHDLRAIRGAVYHDTSAAAGKCGIVCLTKVNASGVG